MAQTNLTDPALEQALKEALVETLQEQRDLLYDVFTEVLEDFALAEAIREGVISPFQRFQAAWSMRSAVYYPGPK